MLLGIIKFLARFASAPSANRRLKGDSNVRHYIKLTILDPFITKSIQATISICKK